MSSHGSIRPRGELELVLYEELRRVAQNKLRQGLGGHSLQVTALVHDVWIKLAQDPSLAFRDRSHFHAVAAQATRWILVDHARRRSSRRHGDARMSVSGLPAADAGSSDEILALDEALDRLAVDHPRKAEVVSLRHFAGLSVEETAEALEISPATVKREWAFARAWLLRRLHEGDSRDSENP